MTDTLTITEEVAQLRDLKRAAARAAETAKDLAADHTAAELRLHDRMEEEGVESLKHDGTNFIPVETIYAQVQDRAAFIAWAEANDESLVEIKERKALLAELVREKLDNGEALPDGVGFYVKKYISQRGS